MHLLLSPPQRHPWDPKRWKPSWHRKKSTLSVHGLCDTSGRGSAPLLPENITQWLPETKTEHPTPTLTQMWPRGLGCVRACLSACVHVEKSFSKEMEVIHIQLLHVFGKCRFKADVAFVFYQQLVDKGSVKYVCFVEKQRILSSTPWRLVEGGWACGEDTSWTLWGWVSETPWGNMLQWSHLPSSPGAAH